MGQSNSIVEALFFKCYYSYLKGDLEDTTMFYAMLKEEFRTEGCPNALSDYQFRELARVKSALDGGSVSSKGWLEEPTQDIRGSAADMSQKDLVKKIYLEGTTTLRDLLNARDTFYLYNIEHPCGQYGFVDMFYRDDETAFPLEVMVGEGDHKLIGQIMKYDLSCRLHLHEKFYFRVQAVTLCSSYNDYTLAELKRNGVVPLLYTMGEKIHISRL
jgi:hypothetical protein